MQMRCWEGSGESPDSAGQLRSTDDLISELRTALASERFCKTHICGTRSFPWSFNTAALVEWLIENRFCHTRDQASKLGQDMMDRGIFHCVDDDQDNFDESPISVFRAGKKKVASFNSGLSPRSTPQKSPREEEDPYNFLHRARTSTPTSTNSPSILTSSLHDDSVDNQSPRWVFEPSAEAIPSPTIKSPKRKIDKDLSRVTERLIADQDALFVHELSLPRSKQSKVRSAPRASSDAIARWLIENEFCRDRYEAGRLGRALLERNVLIPLTGPQGQPSPTQKEFDPSSRWDFFMLYTETDEDTRFGCSSPRLTYRSLIHSPPGATHRSDAPSSPHLYSMKKKFQFSRSVSTLAVTVTSNLTLIDNTRRQRGTCSVAKHLERMRNQGVIGPNTPRTPPTPRTNVNPLRFAPMATVFVFESVDAPEVPPIEMSIAIRDNISKMYEEAVTIRSETPDGEPTLDRALSEGEAFRMGQNNGAL